VARSLAYEEGCYEAGCYQEAASPWTPAPPPHAAALAATATALRWLVEIEVARVALLGAGTEGDPYAVQPVTLRYASRGFRTAATDDPAGVHVAGRLQPFSVSRRLGTRADRAFAPTIEATAGQVTLANADRGLDGHPSAYVLSGRPVRLMVAPVAFDADGNEVDPPLSAYATVFAGVTGPWSYAGTEVRVPVGADSARLDREVGGGAAYQGTGGIEGPADLKGRAKPQSFGDCRGVEPVLIDAARLVYQAHGGPMMAFTGVRDGGVGLRPTYDWDTWEQLMALVPFGTVDEEGEPVRADIGEGEYATCAALGLLRLGSVPAGRLTCDLRGAGGYSPEPVRFDNGALFDNGAGFVGRTEGGAYAGGVRAIARKILREQAGLTSAQVDDASFLAFDGSADPAAGLHVPAGSTMTVGQAVSRLLDAGGHVLPQDADGRYRLSRLDLADTAGLVEITDSMIEGLAEAPAPPYGEPWSAWKVGFGRCWSPLSAPEIFAGAPEAARAFLSREQAFAEARDPALAALFPEGKTGTVDGLLREESAAQAEAARRLALYGRDPATGRVRGLVALTALGVTGRVRLTRPVRVTSSRLGLQAGRVMIAVEVAEEGQGRRTRLLLFG
jgi:hypothetical protein